MFREVKHFNEFLRGVMSRLSLNLISSTITYTSYFPLTQFFFIKATIDQIKFASFSSTKLVTEKSITVPDPFIFFVEQIRDRS